MSKELTPEIIEGNKLIAEFMGFKRVRNLYWINDEGVVAFSFRFHSCWNELMKVFWKINTIDGGIYDFWIGDTLCKIMGTTLDNQDRGWPGIWYITDTYETGDKLRAPFDCCVDFIKWHNSLTSNTRSNGE